MDNRETALLSDLEKSRLLKIVGELGLEVPPERLDPLFKAVTEILLLKMHGTLAGLLNKIAAGMGREIAKNVAGDAGEFHVRGRHYGDWIQCESGRSYLEPGRRFEITFMSGLSFFLAHEETMADDSFEFGAEGTLAEARFGTPTRPGFHSLELSLGQQTGNPPSLRFFFEANRVQLSSKEFMIKIEYTILRRNELIV